MYIAINSESPIDPIAFFGALLQICLLLLSSCAATNTSTPIILVGSTPGDEPVKTMLSISENTTVDFIKWSLKLDEKSTFVLDIIYGESQPNTLGFKGGGKTKTIKGIYLIIKKEGLDHFKEVYQLKSNQLPENISLVKVGEGKSRRGD